MQIKEVFTLLMDVYENLITLDLNVLNNWFVSNELLRIVLDKSGIILIFRVDWL